MFLYLLLGHGPHLVRVIVSGEVAGRQAITVVKAAVLPHLSHLPGAGPSPLVLAQPHPPPAPSVTS